MKSNWKEIEGQSIYSSNKLQKTEFKLKDPKLINPNHIMKESMKLKNASP